MKDVEIKKFLAQKLGQQTLDRRLWNLLLKHNQDNVDQARRDDLDELNILWEYCVRYLDAATAFYGPDSVKRRHLYRPLTLRDSLHAEALWVAQIEAAFHDPDTVRFRKRVLDGRVVDADEALALLASPAVACFPLATFREHGIVLTTHQSEIVTGRINARPGDKIVVRVDPGGLIWERTLSAPPLTLDVTDLPRNFVVEERWPIPEDYADEPDDELVDDFLSGIPGVGISSWDEVGDYVFDLYAWPGSVLSELVELAQQLSVRYSLGNPAHCLWFPLAGDAPFAPPSPIRAAMVRDQDGARLQYIRVDALPWVSVDAVTGAYRRLQQTVHSRASTISIRNLVMFHFITWEKLSEPNKPWPDLLAAWNDRLSGWQVEHPDWQVVTSGTGSWRWAHWRDLYDQYESVRAAIQAEFLTSSSRRPK